MVMEIDLEIHERYGESPWNDGDPLTFFVEFDPNAIYTGTWEFSSPLSIQLELPDGSLTSLEPSDGQLMIDDGTLCFSLWIPGEDDSYSSSLSIDLHDPGLDDLLSTLQWELHSTDTWLGVWATDSFLADITSLSIYSTVPEPGYSTWSCLLLAAWGTRQHRRLAQSRLSLRRT